MRIEFIGFEDGESQIVGFDSPHILDFPGKARYLVDGERRAIDWTPQRDISTLQERILEAVIIPKLWDDEVNVRDELGIKFTGFTWEGEDWDLIDVEPILFERDMLTKGEKESLTKQIIGRAIPYYRIELVGFPNTKEE